MTGHMDWIDALAIFHGGVSIGLTFVVIARHLWSRTRLPMLLLSLSYVGLTAYTVRSVATWGVPWSPWFWLALACWMLGDAGLVLYVILGPSRPKMIEVPQ